MRRPWKLVLAAAVAVIAFGGFVTAAPPVGATDVGDEEALRAAFTDRDETVVTLTANIVLDDCSELGGDLDRSSPTDVTIEGAGHSISQTCRGERVLESSGSATLTLRSVTLAGGSPVGSASGGAVLAQGPVVIDTSTFMGNSTDGHGGAVDAPLVSVSGASLFIGNRGDAGGGAISAGSVIVSGSAAAPVEFTANTSSIGGAIEGGNVNLVFATFVGNRTGGQGGAVLGEDRVDVFSSSFEDNASTASDGGAIWSRSVTVDGSTFMRNSAANNGGAIVSAEDVTVSGASVFAVNHTGSAGGAIFANTVDVVGVAAVPIVFTRNSALSGGAVSAVSASLRFAAFADNSASGQGGAVNAGAGGLEIVSSSFERNRSTGSIGGAIATGTVTVASSHFSENAAAGSGGAIRASTAAIDSSTFAANTADSGGGVAANGAATITNSTVTGNSATTSGGGVFGESVRLTHATVVANSAPDAANVLVGPDPGGELASFGSVVALPAGGGNCAVVMGTTVAELGYNFSDDDSCGFTAPTDVQNGGDPMLGALADNGGPTQTRLPMAGSPLVDGIPVEDCHPSIAVDQRGVARPVGDACDIGAVEVVTDVPPVAVDDQAEVAEDSGLNVLDVLANDSDFEGGALTITAVTQGSNGTVAITGGGAGLITYQPNANFAGLDTFTYTITDPSAQTATATVTVTVVGVNDPPVAADDTATVVGGSTVTIDVLANDTDVDGDTLAAVVIAPPANGDLACSPTGMCTYTPEAGFTGTDTFTYAADDGVEPDGIGIQAVSDPTTVSITVTPAPVQPPPTPSPPAPPAPQLPVTGVGTVDALWWAVYLLSAGAALLLARTPVRGGASRR